MHQDGVTTLFLSTTSQMLALEQKNAASHLLCDAASGIVSNRTQDA